MISTLEITIVGTVTTTVKANLRQDAPSVAAAVARKLDAGTTLDVYDRVLGQSIQGNANWYRVTGNCYIWAGACGALAPRSGGASAPESTGTTAAGAEGPSAGIPMVIDLSHHNTVTSFAEAKLAGVVGVIHKATTGENGRDDAYARRRADAVAAGLLWGAYHWGTGGDVAKQVKNFVDNADLKQNDGVLAALDFEATPGNQMSLLQARAFLDALEQTLGRSPVLYGGSLLKEQLGGASDKALGKRRLWLAQYGPRAVVPLTWADTGYWLWQYSDGTAGTHPAGIPGIPGNSGGCVDCDHFRGAATELAAQWAG